MFNAITAIKIHKWN